MLAKEGKPITRKLCPAKCNVIFPLDSLGFTAYCAIHTNAHTKGYQISQKWHFVVWCHNYKILPCKMLWKMMRDNRIKNSAANHNVNHHQWDAKMDTGHINIIIYHPENWCSHYKVLNRFAITCIFDLVFMTVYWRSIFVNDAN